MMQSTLPDTRNAASLMLLRDAPDGHAVEVLMLRRADRAGDLRSGAAVFPGGVLDPREGTLRYVNAGHPPAIYLPPRTPLNPPRATRPARPTGAWPRRLRP
jgi:8-oxo-dGTP pyrophosphatase MutT (NUDIX family)